MIEDLEFASLVDRYYAALYQFAFSRTRWESEASDLTQETFLIGATKGHQLRDRSKVKTWLFTTLHREFLERRRRQDRFPHVELAQAENEIPPVMFETLSEIDSSTVVETLGRLDAAFQAPVALFYLKDHSYKEIAEILGIPLGTVKSRISRGIAQLQQLLAPRADPKPNPLHG